MNNSIILEKKINLLYSPFYFFVAFCSLSFIITFLTNKLIITEDLIYNSFAEQLTSQRIERIIATRLKFDWISYILSPIFIFLKFVIIAIVLNIGDILKDYKIGFKNLFQAAMIAETIFFIPKLIKLFWFLFFYEAQTMQEFGDFNFLSLLSMFNKDEIYPWLIYPFSLANIFELIYWLFLAFLISKFSKLDYNKSLGLVLSTYFVALIVWLVFVMFISLNIS
ncbi:MAG: hypothetical protein JXR51_16110 [Bacteroidales bacterium]|nr:hypothetical protein [Bacteroidales bacterium]MBN2758692.1 hypothetical protein [Bacteroidales bacterium]